MKALLRPINYVIEKKVFLDETPFEIVKKGIEVSFMLQRNETVKNMRDLCREIIHTSVIFYPSEDTRKSVIEMSGGIFIKADDPKYYEKDWFDFHYANMNFLDDNGHHGKMKGETSSNNGVYSIEFDIRSIQNEVTSMIRKKIESLLGVSIVEYYAKRGSKKLTHPTPEDLELLRWIGKVNQELAFYVSKSWVKGNDDEINIKNHGAFIGFEYEINYTDDFEITVS